MIILIGDANLFFIIVNSFFELTMHDWISCILIKSNCLINSNIVILLLFKFLKFILPFSIISIWSELKNK